MSMQVENSELLSILEGIWATTLDLPLGDESEASPGSTRSLLTGCVHITGKWRGALIFECPIELARRIASAMFGMEPGEVTNTEIADAIGEIANIAGGNFKSLLPSPAEISLPTVVAGAEYLMVFGGTHLVQQVVTSCEGQRIVLRVVEGETTSSTMKAAHSAS